MMLSSYSQKEIQNIIDLIRDNQQKYILFSGGVGVGKTLYAKYIAEELAEDVSQIEVFPFGEHFCYENFIYGLSVGDKSGELIFQSENQRFLKLCKRAHENVNKKYVAIWDDINRTDISQTLGEVLSALESKDVGNAIHTGTRRVLIPDNLYIIATMNPLVGKETLDYAWMRRFLHYTIHSDEKHFGFDWKGEDVGEGYKQIIESSWNAAYAYDESKKIWKENESPIIYDTDDRINEVGLAFLRQYQWDIYMHIKIMFNRYFIDTHDVNKGRQYMLGHGLFLTYNENCSYGKNLVLFHESIQHVVVPLLEKYLEDEVLTNGANPDVKCLKCLVDENVFPLKSISLPSGKDAPMARSCYSLINEIGANYRTCEQYWFFMFGNQLRRMSNGAIKFVCYLCERKEFMELARLDIGSETDNAKPRNCHYRNSGWNVDGFDIHTPAQLNKSTLVTIDRKDSLDNIEKLLRKQALEIDVRRKVMSKCIENVIGIMDDLNVRQMILQGPPGTSKTYGAKYDIIAPQLPGYEPTMEPTIVRELLEKYMVTDYKCYKKSCGWDMVQFHPSYGYEDFVRGITVSTNENQAVIYETVDKILGKMCKLAERYEDDENSKFFLIIDEINRADIATVFGELIYALECRGEEVSIPYAVNGSHKLRIPKNLYIIGTMNTADKSIGTIDYAIRRRFLFFDCLPDVEVVSKYIKEGALRVKATSIMSKLKKFIDDNIDKNYHAKDLYIGHTYFLVDSEQKLKLRLQYQILPILREYYENGVLSKLQDNNTELNTYLLGKKEANDETVQKIYEELSV